MAIASKRELGPSLRVYQETVAQLVALLPVGMDFTGVDWENYINDSPLIGQDYQILLNTLKELVEEITLLLAEEFSLRMKEVLSLNDVSFLLGEDFKELGIFSSGLFQYRFLYTLFRAAY